MKKKIFITITLALITSIIIFLITIFPVFIRVDDSVDLGNDYSYIQDYPQTIVTGNGKEIIFPIILQYAYNDTFIIAKTKDLETKDTLFWIVNKMNNNSERYWDSTSFIKELRERKIKLKID